MDKKVLAVILALNISCVLGSPCGVIRTVQHSEPNCYLETKIFDIKSNVNEECENLEEGDQQQQFQLLYNMQFPPKAIKHKCDQIGMEIVGYKEANCQGVSDTEKIQWGQCQEIKFGQISRYIQVTGAVVNSVRVVMILALGLAALYL